jgi:hypothetical protein
MIPPAIRSAIMSSVVAQYTRNGYNFADRFPKIVEAVLSLPVRSCFIDGEAIVVDETGLSVFELLRYRHHDHAAVLCARVSAASLFSRHRDHERIGRVGTTSLSTECPASGLGSSVVRGLPRAA